MVHTIVQLRKYWKKNLLKESAAAYQNVSFSLRSQQLGLSYGRLCRIFHSNLHIFFWSQYLLVPLTRLQPNEYQRAIHFNFSLFGASRKFQVRAVTLHLILLKKQRFLCFYQRILSKLECFHPVELHDLASVNVLSIFAELYQYLHISRTHKGS